MRVDSNRPIRQAAGRRDGKPGVSGTGGFADALATDSAAGTSSAAPIGALGALFALQEVPDATTERRRKAIDRGSALLDRLGDLQRGLLEGKIDPGSLADLAATARAARARTEDPALQDVLDQIELRAAVELAKLGQPE